MQNYIIKKKNCLQKITNRPIRSSLSGIYSQQPTSNSNRIKNDWQRQKKGEKKSGRDCKAKEKEIKRCTNS
jgi:hypothetical protein